MNRGSQVIEGRGPSCPSAGHPSKSKRVMLENGVEKGVEKGNVELWGSRCATEGDRFENGGESHKWGPGKGAGQGRRSSALSQFLKHDSR